MQARNFLCTKNLVEVKLEMSAEEYLRLFFEKTAARYVVGQLEKGETGNLHIQFFANYEKPKRLAALLKFDPKIHGEKVKYNNGADRYCMKEETRVEGPWEFGKRPIKRDSKTDWSEVWRLAAKGEIDKIPSPIKVIHYNKLKAIAKDHIKPKDADHLRGIWITGPAGSGKSRYVRENIPPEELYDKNCNKWWDGYLTQKYVVLDDWMPEHEFLAYHLKKWADRYACTLETKGGAVAANYQWIIVTSQYSIEECFKDEKSVDAIKRRFTVYNIKELLSLNINIFN